MADGMFAAPVAGIMEDRRRWSWTAKRLIVTDISPDPACIGLRLRQDRDCRVIAMQSLGGQDMRFDEAVERHQRRGAGSNLIGQGGKAELDTFAGIAIALAVEWLVRSELLEQQHRQEAGAEQSAGRDMERCRGLGDLLAIPARELLPDGLDHLPLAGDDLERLGDILTQLAQTIGTTARAGLWRGDDDAVARQMIGQWLACGPLAFARCDVG